jgi:hypothetical protein
VDPLTEAARRRWDELLATSGGGEERHSTVRRRLRELGLEAGEQPLCAVLRPHLISEADLAHQTEVAGVVLSAAGKVRDALLADRRLRDRHLGSFADWIEKVLELEARPAGVGALIRLDASLARTQLHFIELNADMPQGVGHHDSILEFFSELDPYRELAEEYELRPLTLEPPMRETLLSVWSEWGGRGSPTIAVLTHTDDAVRVSSLAVDIERYAASGLDAFICGPEELDFDGSRLRAGDREIDLVHRVIGTAEILEGGERTAPLLAAARAGAVCIVNPFRSELIGHKAIFALMTDPESEFGFSAAERETIRRHVPWTRQVFAGPTTAPDGTSIAFPDYLLAERERLVLKPAHDFGGHGVHLGWRMDESEWFGVVQQALAADYIAQRRVPLHRESYPTIEAAGAASEYFEDTDPFLFTGQVEGFLTRLSAHEITNVHAGGSVIPTIAVGAKAG